MRTSGSLGLAVILQCISFYRSSGGGNDILGLKIPKEPHLDPNTVCKTYPDLTAEQYVLCSKQPDVTASAIQGVQIAIHECQYQFRAHRWNCSTLETKNKNPHSNVILSKGYKETAFAYAISAAGIVSQVARACSLGKLESCACDMSSIHINALHNKRKYLKAKLAQEWRWRGCNHNVDFGDNFAKKFLDSKERAKDLVSQMHIHNNRAGRLLVKQNVRTICKCHGMSGSCEVKTCWKATLPFQELGYRLKHKYRHATKIDNSNSAEARFRPVRKFRRKRKKIRNTDLVYFQRSPNFCEADEQSSGTMGRYCNKTSTDIDNCETLCCGRGYNTLRVTRTQRCHCRFHWCCYVECQKCTISAWVTVCK